MRYIIRLFSVACCAVAVFSGAPATAEKRVALVIGNADYKVGPLQNPVNDAVAVAEAFNKLGFDKVILRRNLGAEAFRAALREMAREAHGAELGAIYFAGHGTEVGAAISWSPSMPHWRQRVISALRPSPSTPCSISSPE